MTVTDIHNSIKLAVDESNAAKNAWLDPDEIDAHFNDVLNEFFISHIAEFNVRKQGFESSKKRLSEFKHLLVADLKLDTYLPLDSKGSYDLDLQKVVALLPSNCRYIARSKSIIRSGFKTCSKEDVSSETTYYFAIKLGESMNISDYSNFSIVIGQTLLIDATEHSSNFPEFLHPFDYSAFINRLINLIDNKTVTDGQTAFTVNAYYEKFQQKYEKNSLIVTIKSPNGTPVTNVTAIANITQEQVSEVQSFISYKLSKTEGTKSIKRNRFVERQIDFDSHPFNRTWIEHPICTVKEDYLELYYDEQFVIEGVYVDYLKEPTLLNSKTNEIPELEQSVIVELIRRTARRIAAILDNKSYQIAAAEELKNE